MVLTQLQKKNLDTRALGLGGIILGMVLLAILISWQTGFFTYVTYQGPNMPVKVYLYGFPLIWREISFKGELINWSNFIANSLLWVFFLVGGFTLGIFISNSLKNLINRE
ncbi:MAG: hypothetical protein ACFFCZ_09670 [Promethearchaeota archaeon]